MFKEMRRKDREIFNEEIDEVLVNGEYGILSTISENGYPYAIPLSYVYYENAIYFHCAKEGQKLENINKNFKVSFCVVGNTEVLPDKFSTNYKSVVVFGDASEVNDEMKEIILLEIIKKYSAGFLEEGKKYIEKGKSHTKIIKINIDHITGKSKK